ncbi:MAG: hypothetical protein IM526_02680 [Microcystis sp. M38BS1]|nr:hypothetical protein [Microcystis sp. M38BS1]MCA6582566.1 hypothetical protein [Pseudanabaena sp. M34BS1SP1A06MG]
MNAVESADGATLSPIVRNAINDFVVGCKYDLIWDSIKSCCLLSGAATLAGALVPLKGTAPTNYNFVSADYNRKTGLKGNASNKYLDSNRADNADAIDNCHISIFMPEPAAYSTAYKIHIGVLKDSPHYSARIVSDSDSSGKALIYMRYGGNPVEMSYSAGFMGGNRNNSSYYTARISGVNATQTQVSDTPSSGNILVFAGRFGSSIIRYSDARLSFYSIGSSIDLALLDAHISTFMNKLSLL